jgi:hypothetical protein
MKVGMIKIPPDFKDSGQITDIYNRVNVAGMYEADNYMNIVGTHRDFVDIPDLSKIPIYKPIYVMGIFVGMIPTEV